MASGTIQNPLGTEIFTPTVVTGNNFAIKSWGFVKGYRVGNFVVITAHGIYNTSAVTSDKTALRIPYKCLDAVSAVGLGGTSHLNFVAALPTSTGTDIKMNFLTADEASYFEITIPVE